MLEQKVVLVSEHKEFLSHCSFALLSLLYPLSWTNVFIPILPKSMKLVIEAPCPFLVGTKSKILNQLESLSSEVIVVYLDYNTIRSSSPIIHPFFAKFKKDLNMIVPSNYVNPKIILDTDKSQREFPCFTYIDIRNCFLKYISNILQGFQNCIVLIL